MLQGLEYFRVSAIPGLFDFWKVPPGGGRAGSSHAPLNRFVCNDFLFQHTTVQKEKRKVGNMDKPATARVPATIGIKDVSAAVHKAVTGLKLPPAPFHVGPIIMGIIFRPQDLPQAEKVAAEITNQVKTAHGAALAGATLEPSVLIRGGIVTCGFIAPEVNIVE
jgi:hypothetical protein